MVRPSKKNTNLLCIDAGYSRKEQFKAAIPRNKSVTDAIIDYMQSVIDEHAKKIKLTEQSKCPVRCVNTTLTYDKQTTLDKYFNFWILDYQNWKYRQEVFDSLDDTQQTEVMIALNYTTRAWQGMKRSKEIKRHE